MKKLRNEKDDLWKLIYPTLKGTWRRLEVITPDGIPDAFGLYGGRTHWLELKIGVPSIKKLRPAQRAFANSCLRHSEVHWTCFGHRGKARYFRDLNFSQEAIPDFVA